MSYFSVRVMYSNGQPAGDIGVMIDYGLFNGTDKKRHIQMVGLNFIIMGINPVQFGLMVIIWVLIVYLMAELIRLIYSHCNKILFLD
jgi:hypothetical protein